MRCANPFALLGFLGEVDGVFLQRLALLLGIGVVHRLATAHVLDGLLQRTLGGTGLAQDVAQRALILQRCQHEQLGGDVLVTLLLGQLVGDVEQAVEVVGDMHLALGALHPGQVIQCLTKAGTQLVHVHTGLGQQVTYAAAFLVEHGDHQVDRLDELVILAHGKALGIGQGHLEFAGQFVHPHCFRLP